MILTIKTDQPVAELALFDQDSLIDSVSWEAHRQLAATILRQISELLEKNEVSFSDLSGVVVFEGPGSFTGLRIGATVANTLAYSLDVPVVGAGGDEWQTDGVTRLADGENQHIVKPVYGGEPNITKPKK